MEEEKTRSRMWRNNGKKRVTDFERISTASIEIRGKEVRRPFMTSPGKIQISLNRL